ncbi:MAG: N-acetylmuramoyl-L-alanine amidase [Azoarcus sp.]|nr:N-acetylmuramoyl-L-alanine amidase [Azoarcus sp.]
MICRLSRYCLLPLALCLALGACVTPPPKTGNARAQWQPSPSFGVRKANYVILHHTSSSTLARALAALTSPVSDVSSHYLIGRDGHLLQLVDENQRAWHAGESYWGGLTDMNSASIGIELVNTGKEAFPPAQIDALLALLSDLRARYNIPRANFIGHADVAPGRKTDPSDFFPWRQLAMAGFGLWCEPPFELPPDNFNALFGLSVFGYDVRDPWKAVASFKLHFSPGGGKDMSQADRGMLYCLLQQVMTSGRQ